MNQEDKELLLKDLCARLPYGVKVTWDGKYPLTVTPHIYCAIASEHKIDNLPKLLLRSTSSMTDEECHEYNMHLLGITTGVDAMNFMIWIYQHHLDILHFIDKGLALEAPEGMYSLNKE